MNNKVQKIKIFVIMVIFFAGISATHLVAQAATAKRPITADFSLFYTLYPKLGTSFSTIINYSTSGLRFPKNPEAFTFRSHLSNVFFNYDYMKTEATLFYFDDSFVGALAGHYTPAVFRWQQLQLIPSIGIGFEVGLMGSLIFNGYIPITLKLDIIRNQKWDLNLWLQGQFYLVTTTGFKFWVGGKAALEMTYKISRYIGLQTGFNFAATGGQMMIGWFGGAVIYM